MMETVILNLSTQDDDDLEAIVNINVYGQYTPATWEQPAEQQEIEFIDGVFNGVYYNAQTIPDWIYDQVEMKLDYIDFDRCKYSSDDIIEAAREKAIDDNLTGDR